MKSFGKNSRVLKAKMLGSSKEPREDGMEGKSKTDNIGNLPSDQLRFNNPQPESTLGKSTQKQIGFKDKESGENGANDTDIPGNIDHSDFHKRQSSPKSTNNSKIHEIFGSSDSEANGTDMDKNVDHKGSENVKKSQEKEK